MPDPGQKARELARVKVRRGSVAAPVRERGAAMIIDLRACQTQSVPTTKSEKALRYLLDGFSRREDYGDIWTSSEMVRVEPTDLPVPSLVLFLLTNVMGMVNLGREEKTEWHVPVTYRGHRVTVASQKFGLRLYVLPTENSGEAAGAIAAEVVGRLRKALRIVEREVLADHAKQQLNDGRLTIANQSGRQRAMYEHFRGAAITAFSAAEKPTPPEDDEGIDSILAGVREKFHQSQIGAWEAIAAVNAYFSLLEHELVLVSAFSDLDPTGGALENLIGDRWAEKFRKLLDLGNSDAKRVYDRLHEIAETYRNPYSHGGFDKQGATLWFHLDGIGAVPARLRDIRSSPHFELFPVQPEDFTMICADLDQTASWLRDGQYAAGFEWIDAGLDVAFDEESRRDYRQLTVDPQYRRELIERHQYHGERAANFDW
jgi:hypothetical protein